MNLTNLKVSFISAAALALSASQGFAQTSTRVWVKVPFEFTAGTTVLPAGNYSFSEDRFGVMYINSAENRKAIMVLTNSEPNDTARETNSLKFEKVNGQYSLMQVNLVNEPAHRIIHVEEKSGVITSKLAAK